MKRTEEWFDSFGKYEDDYIVGIAPETPVDTVNKVDDKRTRLEVEDQILELIQLNGTMRAPEVAKAIGYTRANERLKALVDRGVLFMHGKAKSTFYSLHPNPVKSSSKKKQLPKLPDMPKLMLQWGGYTNMEPDLLRAKVYEEGRLV